MAARPTTSGGPNEKASAFLGLNSTLTAADRRISRDDMSLPSARRSRKGLQPYRIGIVRGDSFSNPDLRLPRNHQPYSPLPSDSSAANVVHTAGSSTIPIGMALGSPAHPPEVYSTRWQQQSLPIPRPLTPPPLANSVPVSAVQRQKSQRRKLFGGLFGSRKHAEQAKPSSKWAPSVDSLPSGTTPVSGHQDAPARSKTIVNRKPSKHKPTMSRSNSEPVGDTHLSGGRGSTGRKSQGWRPLIPDETNSYLSAMPSASSDYKRAGERPLLDVQIPSITLERYSVMFGSLLDSEASSSSLLARRQATLDRLRTIKEGASRGEDEKERVRQRRATSPLPTDSPAFNLFPSAPRSHAPPLLQPKSLDVRSRSYTSPALLPSPSRTGFDMAAPQKGKKTVTIISPRTMEQHHPRTMRGMNENQARKHGVSGSQEDLDGFHFGPDVSGLILDSPRSITSFDDDGDRSSILDSHPLKPQLLEPEWEIISRPVAEPQLPTFTGSSSTTTSTHRSHPSSTFSVSTHATQSSVDIGESDPALKAAVEISIARQISISRQQRMLLKPLKTEATHSSSKRTGTGRRTSPVEKVVIPRDHGRVVETKSGTPTVVVPRETLESYPEAHRKSEMVVLDEL